jgi:Peptidase S46
LSERREGVERVYRLLELGDGLATKLFSFALELVRLADETGKPDAERLDGYNEVDLPALKRWLFAETAIDEGLEIRRLADSLAFLQEELSSNQDWVRQVLAGKSPGERASELIRESRLGDTNVRRALAEGGRGAVASSNDPMIALARLLDGQTRKVRSELFDDVEEQIRRERLRIAAAIRAVAGHDDYPDASGTLRLSFGRVKKLDAETDADSTFWTLNSLFWSLQGRSPIAPSQIHSALEPRSIRVRRGLNFDTPFLFESDVDCSFGNSGSPVLNQRGEQIGVLSRGPSEALYLTYEYDDQRCRGMAMHMAGIVEVLVNVYGALELVRELTGVD